MQYSKPKEFKTYDATEYSDFMEIQQLFIDFDKTNIDETIEILLKNKYLKTIEGLSAFVDDLFRVLIIRHKDTDLFADLIKKLSQKGNKDNKCADLLKVVVKRALEPSHDWRLNERTPVYFFLRKLYLSKLIDLDPIVDAVDRWPKEEPLQHIMLFYYFEPDMNVLHSGVVDKTRALFTKLRKQFKHDPKINQEEQKFLKLSSKMDMFERNNFELLKEYITYGSPKDSIQYAIKRDDVDLLDKIVQRDNVDLSLDMEENEFEPFLFVHWNPKPAEYAAFFGSPKCFKYIIKKKVSLQYLTMFAIAGGNEEILKRMASKKATFEHCPRIAAYMRRLDLFEWIMTRHSMDLNKKKELNYALCRACAINYIDMIVQLIDIGANINFKDENQQSPLMCAASNDCLEAVQYLMKYPSLRVNDVNAFGYKTNELSKDRRINILIQEAIDLENQMAQAEMVK